MNSPSHKIKVSYSDGKAVLDIPQKVGRKEVTVKVKVTEEQGDALRDALSHNAMWRGDGFTSYDWPATPPKRKKKK